MDPSNDPEPESVATHSQPVSSPLKSLPSDLLPHEDATKGPEIAATAEFSPDKSNAVPSVTAQLNDPDIKDYVWNVPPYKVPAPVVDGISNDDLYMLLRRFNKKVSHVKVLLEPPTDSLDLEYSMNEEFSPDKLRATLERFYMTVIIGMAAFGKHIARLRSWNEPWRTAWFCIMYYLAWFFNLILALFLTTLAMLILEPRSRRLLFPPAPISIISARTGNLQMPKAGTVGSDDSLSGAQEKHQGEAVEQEARHFVSGFATIAVSTATGKGPGDDGNGNTVGGGEATAQSVEKHTSAVDGAVPDPVDVVLGGVEAKYLASGDDASNDAAKQPVNDAIWNKARPFMQTLDHISDGWERWGNAFSPTPPFAPHAPRIRLAGPLLLLVMITYFVKAALYVHVMTFLLGLAFFGQPLLVRAAHWLTHNLPNWREHLELRRTLLVGVPTNAQLTLTLLRFAEKHKAPLPPPPTSLDAPTARDPISDPGSDIEIDLSNYEMDKHESAAGDNESYTSKSATGENDGKESTSSRRTPGKKVAGFLKRAVKAGVTGALTLDQLQAAAGSENARRRIGAVSDPPLTDVTDVDTMPGLPDGETPPERLDKPDNVPKKVLPGPIENGEGPSVFSARFHGKQGHVLLIGSATSPCVAFAYTKLRRKFKHILGLNAAELDSIDIIPQFTIGLADIAGLRKVGGLGWKGKMIVGWALGREVVDGLEITDREGNCVVLTAIRGRDELFNRLIAMGEHRWECW